MAKRLALLAAVAALRRPVGRCFRVSRVFAANGYHLDAKGWWMAVPIAAAAFAIPAILAEWTGPAWMLAGSVCGFEIVTAWSFGSFFAVEAIALIARGGLASQVEAGSARRLLCRRCSGSSLACASSVRCSWRTGRSATWLAAVAFGSFRRRELSTGTGFFSPRSPCWSSHDLSPQPVRVEIRPAVTHEQPLSRLTRRSVRSRRPHTGFRRCPAPHARSRCRRVRRRTILLRTSASLPDQHGCRAR